MKKIQFGYVISPDGTKTEVHGEGKDGRFSLEQMYRLLDCQMVERLQLRPSTCQGFKEVSVDEEGRLKPNAFNPAASAISAPYSLVGKALFIEARKRVEDPSEV